MLLSVVCGTSAVSGRICFLLTWALRVQGGKIHLCVHLLSKRCELKQVQEQEEKYVAFVSHLFCMVRTSLFQDILEPGD